MERVEEFFFEQGRFASSIGLSNEGNFPGLLSRGLRSRFGMETWCLAPPASEWEGRGAENVPQGESRKGEEKRTQELLLIVHDFQGMSSRYGRSSRKRYCHFKSCWPDARVTLCVFRRISGRGNSFQKR